MKVSGLGQSYNMNIGAALFQQDCRRIGQGLARQFTESAGLGRFSEQAGRQILEVSGISRQLQQIAGSAAGVATLKTKFVGRPVTFKFENMFKNEAAGLAKLTKGVAPVLCNYERAQRRASRRFGVIAGLEAPGEASIVSLTAAFTALAAGDQTRLKRLHRRLRTQARNGDEQAEALATWLDVLVELIAAEELGRLLLLVRTLMRIAERSILCALGRSLTRARSSPPWQDPITSGHCPHAPPAISAVPYYPEVAA